MKLTFGLLLLLFPMISLWGQQPIQLTTAGYQESFTSKPLPEKWSTGSTATGITAVSPNTPDEVIIPLAVGVMNQTLPTFTGAVTTGSTGQWNSAGFLQTPPTGVGATFVVAKFQNATGAPVARLALSWELGLVNNNVATPEDLFTGHLLYVSLTGNANTWQPIGIFGYGGNATTPAASPRLASFTLDFPAGWQTNANFFVLWVDDNSGVNPDGLYTIDNFSMTSIESTPIPFVASGFTEDFTTRPIGSRWGTINFAGNSTGITDTASALVSLNGLTPTSITSALGVTTVATATSAEPVWNSGGFVGTAPTGVVGTLLMATLRNDTAAAIPSLDVAYDLGLSNATVDTPEDAFAGHFLSYNLTGLAGGWRAVGTAGFLGNLATPPTTPQTQHFTITFDQPWPPGALLRIAWLDDNSAVNPDALYTIDHVQFSLPLPSGFKIQEISLLPDGKRRVTFPAETGYYYVLYRGADLTAFPNVIGMLAANGAVGEMLDPAPLTGRAFYRVGRRLNTDSTDTDGDGMPDRWEVLFPTAINPLLADANQDADGDGRFNLEEFSDGKDPTVVD